MKRIITAGLIALAVALASPPANASELLRWEELPEIPPAPGRTSQVGLAGPFAGVHKDALIVGGGANFPKAAPWEGGKKVWWDDVYILRRSGEATYQWVTDKRFKLERPLAYGAAVDTEDGLVCIGGCDADRCYADVFLLRWDPEAAAISRAPMPALPRPLAFMAAAKVGNTIYVAGGQETTKQGRAGRHFFALDLSQKGNDETFRWRRLPAWPGEPRVLPVAATQSDGTVDCFYMFSGRNVAPGAATEILTDAWRYHPKDESWKRLADVGPKGEAPRCVMAGTGIGWGANHILIFGGDEGKLSRELEQLGREIAAAGESAAAHLKQRQTKILNTHPGFSRDVLAYHTITDTWVKVGQHPAKSQVTTAAVRWGDAIIIPSGEIRPGVRTPKIYKVTVPPQGRFGLLNYTVLGVYLLALVAMGLFFWRRGKTTDDFFKAGGRIPWWAAGISIFGTQLSALTFMAIPAKTFATDWRYFVGNMAIVMAAPFIAYFYLPFFRRLKVTTSYEYLEKRFNLAARLLGSIMFMIFQFGRIGIVLFLPSLALSVVTGIDVSACILVMGLLCIFYTALGGIEAVIWTDVLQVVVLMGGALLCLVLIAFQVPGGWNEVNSIAESAGKFRTFDFRFDITTATFWVLVFGGFGANLASYGADQTVVQRYLTTKDETAARRSIWCNAVLCIPASILFFMIGSALFAFFKTHPGQVNPGLNNPDAIFPWYIVTQLPAGVAGLLIAGLFAAAMSSLDSSMNSVATAVTTDFYRRFKRNASDRSCLRLARWVTVVIGAAGTAFALAMVQWNIKSLWDQYAAVLGLFLGGLAGLFVLAFFTRRPGGAAAVTALLGRGGIQYLLKRFYPMHPWFYAVTGLVSCVVIGVLVGMILPEKRKSLAGLTIHTLDKGV